MGLPASPGEKATSAPEVSVATPELLARWYYGAFLRILPTFNDEETESFFLLEYRRAGLSALAYACTLGMAAYLVLGLTDVLLVAWNAEAAIRRCLAVALLASTVLLIKTKSDWVIAEYSFLLGSIATITIVGLVSVIHLFREEGVSSLVTPVPLIALWILYGFARLPIKVAIWVGAAGSLFSMFGSPLTNIQEPRIRTFIYLVVANGIGILLARSIELRERQLFLQRLNLQDAQAELVRRTTYAENASEEKTRLIAAVGHDLRQPMLSAVLHAEVLVQRLEANDLVRVRLQAARVEQSVKALGDTLEHLLTAARYDAGTEPVVIEPVLLAPLFHRLNELFQAPAAARGILLRIREPEEGLAVMTDEHAFLRILVNLVSNAIKFTVPRACRTGVIVRASLKGETCRIVVADMGVGIDESDIASIWEPFLQLGNKERNRSKGLGLGLYLVRQSLVRLDAHTIRVKSAMGRGTRFTLTAPGLISMDKRTRYTGVRGIPSLSAGMLADSFELLRMNVLLIEDDQEARNAIEAQLDEWGLRYWSGVSVEEVMEVFSAETELASVIIADFRLPGRLNGAESIQAVRELLGYELPALLITAEVDRETLHALLPPRTLYIQKPFDAAALKAGLTAFTAP